MDNEHGWSEERLEMLIGLLLRGGVLLSASVVLAGGVAFLAAHGGEHPSFRVFQEAPLPYRSLRGVVAAAARLDPLGIVQFGLLLLIATPVARIMLALYGFAKQHDRVYVAITSIVLSVLLFSLIWHS